MQDGTLVRKSFDKMQSPLKDVGLFRVTGVFPTISKDGSKLAFVDNEFKAVWLADVQGLRIVYEGPILLYAFIFLENRTWPLLLLCSSFLVWLSVTQLIYMNLQKRGSNSVFRRHGTRTQIWIYCMYV